MKKVRIALSIVEVSLRLVLMYQIYQRILIEQQFNQIRKTRNRLISKAYVQDTETSDSLTMFGHQN